MNSLTIILVSTVLTISALYVPQPLLPVLAEQFSVSREMAALLTTIVFIPLSLAPLVYGYLLEAVPAKHILGRHGSAAFHRRCKCLYLFCIGAFSRLVDPCTFDGTHDLHFAECGARRYATGDGLVYR